ncbi:MAG: hypothetical protein GY941_02875, partial [Planctomycetes bacterium]|nr:hypothetical protein [Planctomycetota bacterium]
CRAEDQTLRSSGVCWQGLKPLVVCGRVSGKAIAANRIREIRPYGMRGGLAETWVMVELGSRRTTERVRNGNSPPTVARTVFLPDVMLRLIGTEYSYL